jgi:hypothetical protein
MPPGDGGGVFSSSKHFGNTEFPSGQIRWRFKLFPTIPSLKSSAVSVHRIDRLRHSLVHAEPPVTDA